MSSSKSAAAQASHHIDYGQQAVKQFVQQLNSCVHPLDVLKFGVEQQNYESLWNQLLNQDLATVYLTVLLGKLVLSENKLIQLMSSSPQQQQQQIDENADAVNSSYNEELPQLQEVQQVQAVSPLLTNNCVVFFLNPFLVFSFLCVCGLLLFYVW